MTDYPYFMYINNWGGGVYLKECPILAGRTADNLTDVKTLITYGGIYQVEGAELSQRFVQMPDYSSSPDALVQCSHTANMLPEFYRPNSKLVVGWHCAHCRRHAFAYYVGDSYPVLSWCFLTTAASDRIAEIVEANSTLAASQAGAQVW
jgi:hypothetical protein